MSDPAAKQPQAPPADARGVGSGAHPKAPTEPLGLEEIYRQYHGFVWRNLLRLGVPEAQLDDAVHDSFLVLAQRLHEFEGRSSIKTWLFAIIYNVARGVRRDLGRQLSRQSSLSSAAEPATSHSNPETRSDAARQLHALLSQLDETQRVVFVMAELEQMTAPEIGAVLGVKVPTVYSRLRLAREHLEQAVRRMRGT